MAYAARHPAHPAKLVLLSTAARQHRDVTAARFEALGGAPARAAYEAVYFGGERTPEQWARYAEVCLPLYNVARREPSGPRREWSNLRVLEHFNREFFEMDLRSQLGAITCPTLVIGGRDDPMTPPEASVEIAESLRPGIGQLELLDACGHGPHRDQPDRTEALVRAFLAG
jgi:proline iminopeptidase